MESIRQAVIASLRDRVEIAGYYVGDTTAPQLLERLHVLAFAVGTVDGRPLGELKAYNDHALRLVEDLAHGPVPAMRAAS